MMEKLKNGIEYTIGLIIDIIVTIFAAFSSMPVWLWCVLILLFMGPSCHFAVSIISTPTP